MKVNSNKLKNNFKVTKIIFSTKKIICLAIIFFIILATFNYLFLYLQKDLINSITNKNITDIQITLKLIALLSISFYIINGTYNTHIRGYVMNHLYDKIEMQYLKILMRKLYTTNLDTIYTKEFNDKHSFAKDSRIHISKFIISLIELIFENILTIIFVISMIFINKYVVIFLLGYLIIKIILNIIISKKQVKFDKLNANNKRKIDYYKEVLVSRKYGKELKLFKLQDQIYEKYNKSNKEYKNKAYKLIKNNKLITSLIDLISKLINIMLIVFIALYGIKNNINVVEIIIIIQAIILLEKTTKSITNNLLNINKSRFYIKGIKEFLNIKEEKNTTFNEEIKTIKLENLSYKYPNNEEYTLKNINLEVKEKETLCIVGFTGAGKSTLIKILTKLLTKTQGRLLINNKELINQKLNNQFNFMFQDYTKFAFTIKDNIIFGNTDKEFDEERYNYAIEKANLTDMILKYTEDKYLNKSFTDEGIDLSEGMWQSIAFARMLYSNKNIFICDEPTSSLDALKESSYIDSLKDATLNKTAIIITHRLSLTNIADKIAVLEQGEIKEFGSKDELIDKKGLFYKMFKAQKEIYEGDNNE